MTRARKLNKQQFIDKVRSMEEPIFEEKTDEYKILLNYYWLIYDRRNWRNSIETPTIRLTSREYAHKKQENFYDRLKKTQKKYLAWFDEGVDIRSKEGNQ